MNGAGPEVSVAEAGAALRSGRLSSEALTTASLDSISRHNPTVRAFIHVTAERALTEARRADDELARGLDRGPLHGIPYAVKDLFDVAGLPTSCNSWVRAGHVADEDCVALRRMTEAGAVLLGKLHMSEFATGGSGVGLPFPPARNPWNLDRVTGGSSSGSAAAVAAGFVRITLGSDTGGSLRLPAAYCGAVGLKPTFGRVSRRGIFPLSDTLDHGGPLTRSVADAALVLRAIAGFDAADPASVDRPTDDYLTNLDSGVEGLRVGLVAGHFGLTDSLDPKVSAALEAAAVAMSGAGAIVAPVGLPEESSFWAAGMAIMLAEAFALHRSDLAMRLRDYSPETADRLLLGAGVSPEDLDHAQRVRRALSAEVDVAFAACDVVLTASAIGGAGPVGAPGSMLATPRRIASLPFNLTGHPAIHVPTGLDGDGMPIGIQLVGPRFGEATLLRAAAFVETTSGWRHTPLPSLA